MIQPGTTEQTSVPPMQDGIVANRELPIKLPAFEGPLDLLLFLIRRNEVDIYDIPIESVTRQYLDVLKKMETLNLEIAGDFFVMAATLMYIKSRVLLPSNEQSNQPEDEEEDVDPRWELVQQLLEYKKFKEAAKELDSLIQKQQDYLIRNYQYKEENKEARPLKNSDRIEIWNTFNVVLRRLSEKITKGQIQDEEVSLADRMEYLIEYTKTHSTFTFSSLFEGQAFHLNRLVATFLAILELARLKHLTVEQDDNYSEIICAVRTPELLEGQEPSENALVE